jgi:hypothetical protein
VDSLTDLYIPLFLSKLEYVSVVWNRLTLADSNKMENVKTKFANLCYNRFIQPSSFCNYESMLNYLHFKKLPSRQQNLDTIFVTNIFKNLFDFCYIVDIVCHVIPTKQIRDFSTLTSVISQELALQQGASRLQTISESLWTFSINISSPLRIQFPLLNPTE